MIWGAMVVLPTTITPANWYPYRISMPFFHDFLVKSLFSTCFPRRIAFFFVPGLLRWAEGFLHPVGWGSTTNSRRLLRTGIPGWIRLAMWMDGLQPTNLWKMTTFRAALMFVLFESESSTDLSGLRQVWKRRMFSREQRTKLAIKALHIITIALTSFSGQWCILALFGVQLPKHSLHEETNVPLGAGMIHHQFPMNSEVVVGEWINQLLPTSWRNCTTAHVCAATKSTKRGATCCVVDVDASCVAWLFLNLETCFGSRLYWRSCFVVFHLNVQNSNPCSRMFEMPGLIGSKNSIQLRMISPKFKEMV